MTIKSQMSYYLVFAAQAEKVHAGYEVSHGIGASTNYVEQQRPTGRLQWLPTPVGVFRAATPAEACQAAAKRVGTMGTFFALEGTPWGVSLVSSGAEELGLDAARLEIES